MMQPTSAQMGVLKRAPAKVIATLMLLNGFLNIGFLFAQHLGWREHIQWLTSVSQHLSYSAYRTGVVLTVVISIILVMLALGLYRGQRSSWRWAMVILCLLLVRNLIPEIQWLPLGLAVISIAILWFSRKSFTRYGRVLKTPTLIALFSGVFAVAYGSVGSYLLRAQFKGIHHFIDAVYYTFVTYSTVGYGDITPQTQNARLFVITMIVIGLGAFATIVSVVVAPLIERRLKRVLTMVSHFHHLRRHAIICGVTDITLQVASDLHKKGVIVLFIEPDAAKITTIEKEVYEILNADPQNPGILKSAGLKDAALLVCGTQDDAQNILLAMTARTVLGDKHQKHNTKIIVKLERADRVAYAEQSGADDVIVPSILSSRQVMAFLG